MGGAKDRYFENVSERERGGAAEGRVSESEARERLGEMGGKNGKL